jgi:hypothetical protein
MRVDVPAIHLADHLADHLAIGTLRLGRRKMPDDHSTGYWTTVTKY